MSKSFTTTWINKQLEESFFSIFSRTRKIHNDYWYIWTKSGLLEFICLDMRKSYEIPVLDEKEDYQYAEKHIGNDDSIPIDIFKFYDKWDKKEIFKKELESIIYQLRLHRTAYTSLFSKIFYDEQIDINEKWQGYDNESIIQLATLEETINLLGFTKPEIEYIHKEITSYFEKKSNKPLTKEIIVEIENWCNQLGRNIRGLKSKEITSLVVKQMKLYGTMSTGRDENNILQDNLLQSSKICAENITAELPTNDFFDADTFRQTVKRLYKSFPILYQFTSSN